MPRPPFEEQHQLLQVVGGSSKWVDEDFDLAGHNRIYDKLIQHEGSDHDARMALTYSCMGHTVPEEIVENLKEKKLWITATSSDSHMETSKSLPPSKTKLSWWKTPWKTLSSFWKRKKLTS